MCICARSAHCKVVSAVDEGAQCIHRARTYRIFLLYELLQQFWIGILAAELPFKWDDNYPPKKAIRIVS